MRFVEKPDVGYEQKRGVNNDFKRFGLSTWVNGGPLKKDPEEEVSLYREWGWDQSRVWGKLSLKCLLWTEVLLPSRPLNIRFWGSEDRAQLQ